MGCRWPSRKKYHIAVKLDVPSTAPALVSPEEDSRTNDTMNSPVASQDSMWWLQRCALAVKIRLQTRVTNGISWVWSIPNLPALKAPTAVAHQDTVGFAYQELPSYSQIRLIRIEPSVMRAAPLNLELKVFSLHEAPRFAALSYTWGVEHDRRAVLLNGRLFHITANLSDFLTEARSRQTGKRLAGERWLQEWIWVDAISIDQGSHYEKNAIVPQMKQIYQLADEVVVWLGGSPASYSTTQRALDRYTSFYIEPEVIFKRANIPVLSAMLHSPWWTRAWVVQEVMAPMLKDGGPRRRRSANLWLGAASIPFKELVKVDDRFQTLYVEQFGPETETLRHRISGKWRKRAQDLLVRQNTPNAVVGVARLIDDPDIGALKLLNFLQWGRSSKSSNPRDKIYAFLGMAQDPILPEPRYQDSLREVHAEAFKTHVQCYKDLDMLNHSFPLRDSDWPSWLPNWSREEHVIPLSHFPFMACSWYGASAHISEGGALLTATGVSVDIVRDVCDAKPVGKLDFPLERWTEYALEMGDDPLEAQSCREQLLHVLCLGDGRLERTATVRGWLHRPEHPERRERVLAQLRSETLVPFVGQHRTLFRSEKGCLGLGSRTAKPGDKVVILFGCRTPVLLRPVGRDYSFVCDVYLSNAMQGEALRALNVDEEQQSFRIR